MTFTYPLHMTAHLISVTFPLTSMTQNHACFTQKNPPWASISLQLSLLLHSPSDHTISQEMLMAPASFPHLCPPVSPGLQGRRLHSPVMALDDVTWPSSDSSGAFAICSLPPQYFLLTSIRLHSPTVFPFASLHLSSHCWLPSSA